MSKYLTQQQYEAVRKMWEEEDNLSMAKLAKQFGVCEATISNIVRYSTKPRKHRGNNAKNREPDDRDQVVVFKDLPDHVLFQHVKECNFIG